MININNERFINNNSNEEVDLSVIIITRNEEEIIGDCINSVISALNHAKKKNVLNSSEVILVDSASTDNTINIAKKFPIRILQLKPSWPLSAGAGMYTGVLHSKGRYLAKVDGDTIIYEDWFANALPHLQRKEIAGVTGIYVEVVKETGSTGKAYLEGSKNQPAGNVEVIATGIFNKKILLEAGSFNPYLKAAEDRDLSWNISELRYDLIRLPYYEMRHFLAGKEKKITYIEHLKKMYIYSVGEGYAARYSLNNKKKFWKYVRRYATVYFSQIYIYFFLWINLFYSNYLLLNGLLFSRLILLIDILIFLFSTYILIIRHSGHKWDEFLFSFEVIPYMFIRHMGFILGIMKSPKNPSMYPKNIIVIK